jgi:hypothetical protein
MGYRDIWPFRSARGHTFRVAWAPMNAAEGFLAGEPILINADGEAATCVKDGTEILIAEANGGVALNGPGAAVSAELIAADGWGRLWIHPDTGNAYATGDRIWYVPWQDDVEFITSNVVAAGGATAGAAFTGADRGDLFQMSYVAATTPDLGWGIERTAGVHGTDLVCVVTDILDAQLRPVTATGTGTFCVFRTYAL